MYERGAGRPQAAGRPPSEQRRGADGDADASAEEDVVDAEVVDEGK